MSLNFWYDESRLTIGAKKAIGLILKSEEFFVDICMDTKCPCFLANGGEEAVSISLIDGTITWCLVSGVHKNTIVGKTTKNNWHVRASAVKAILDRNGIRQEYP